MSPIKNVSRYVKETYKKTVKSPHFQSVKVNLSVCVNTKFCKCYTGYDQKQLQYQPISYHYTLRNNYRYKTVVNAFSYRLCTNSYFYRPCFFGQPHTHEANLKKIFCDSPKRRISVLVKEPAKNVTQLFCCYLFLFTVRNNCTNRL